MKTRSPAATGYLLVFVMSVVALAACTGSDTGPDGSDAGLSPPLPADQVEGADTVDTDRKPVLRFAVTDSTGSRVTSAIAEYLIENKLGYPVEFVEAARMNSVLADLESGDLDAMIEVWPTSLEPDDRAVIDSTPELLLGELGPVGKIGWFIPRSILTEIPAARRWDGFTDPSVGKAFSSSTSAPRGRLVGIEPSYEQHDSELINSLGLALQVEYSGSEQATIEMLDRARTRGEPILIYWWTPSATIKAFDLVEVTLPARDELCLEQALVSGVDGCDYQSEPLWKLGSPRLASKAPEVYRLVDALTITQEDQIDLAFRIEYGQVGVRAAAKEWVESNEDSWKGWFDG